MAVDTSGGAVQHLASQTEGSAGTYRSHALAALTELGYTVDISQADPSHAVVQIKKGRRVAVRVEHQRRPLTFAMITKILDSAQLSGSPTLLVANQPATLAAAELAADARGFETVHWTGESDNDKLVRGLTSLAVARHRR